MGGPGSGGNRPRNTREIILARIDTSGGPDACHPFDYIGSQGYGQVRFEERTRDVHRLVWEWENGPIPEGMEIDHRCHDPKVCTLRNDCPHRACQNTAHMKLVTHAENVHVERRLAVQPTALIDARRKMSVTITHCPKDHPYDEANTYYKPDGSRQCRACGRAATRQHTHATRPDNTSGYKGVSWAKHAGKWKAQIQIEGRHIYLGYFDDIEEAAAAYDAAASQVTERFTSTNEMIRTERSMSLHPSQKAA